MTIRFFFFRLRHQNFVDKMPQAFAEGSQGTHMTCLRRERVNKIHPGFLFTFLAYFSTVESHRKVNKSAEQS